MKKIVLVLFGILVVSTISISKVNANSVFSEITTTEELQIQLKESNLVDVDASGHIFLKQDINALDINKVLVSEYLELLNLINEQVDIGTISFDENLKVEPESKEEIAEIIYEYDKKHPEEALFVPENEPSITKGAFSIEENNDNTKMYAITASSSKPYLNARELVESNRRSLKSYLKSQLTFNGQYAMINTIGWWVGKVRPGGSWDYKVVSGYKPWNKEFTMQFYSGVETRNSKWLGNYNYGYTGEELFSLSTLLKGGSAVSYALNFTPDTKAVKNVITRGFNNARTYYP